MSTPCASGRAGKLTVKLCARDQGHFRLFKREQGAEYQGTLEIQVDIVDPNGGVLATASGKSWAKESVAENATREVKARRMSVTKTTLTSRSRSPARIRSAMAAYMK